MPQDKLCTSTAVKRVIDATGRWTDAEINTEIEDQTTEIYDECGDPIQSIKSPVGYNSQSVSFYEEYVLGDTHIYKVDRVFLGTTTKRELTATTDYTTASKVGMLKLATTTPGGSQLDQADSILIQYIPGLFSKYCALRAAEGLLEKIDIIDKGNSSKELSNIRDQIEKQEKKLNSRYGLLLSTDYEFYDETYGVVKNIKQDHSRNKYRWKAD